jgi:hypothetical protein
MSKALTDLQELYQYVRAGKQPAVILGYDSAETAVIGYGYTALLNAEEQIRRLRFALEVYSKEAFYEELPPSKAIEDKGALARQVLNETDPAGVV